MRPYLKVIVDAIRNPEWDSTIRRLFSAIYTGVVLAPWMILIEDGGARCRVCPDRIMLQEFVVRLEGRRERPTITFFRDEITSFLNQSRESIPTRRIIFDWFEYCVFWGRQILLSKYLQVRTIGCKQLLQVLAIVFQDNESQTELLFVTELVPLQVDPPLDFGDDVR